MAFNKGTGRQSFLKSFHLKGKMNNGCLRKTVVVYGTQIQRNASDHVTQMFGRAEEIGTFARKKEKECLVEVHDIDSSQRQFFGTGLSQFLFFPQVVNGGSVKAFLIINVSEAFLIFLNPGNF